MSIQSPQEDHTSKALIPTPLNAFQLTAILLDIKQIRAHPDISRYFDDVDADTPELKQMSLILNRLKILATEIDRCKVQIGMILIEGTKLQLQRAIDPGYDSMYQLLIDELFERKLLSECIDRYRLWLYIQKYGCTQDQIEQANPEQLAAIHYLKDKSGTQYEHIARGKAVSEGRQWGTLSEREIQKYYDEVEEQFEHTIKQEIAAILSTEHPDLHQQEPLSSHGSRKEERNEKPKLIIKDPEYDPNTGAFYAKDIIGYIDPDQFQAIKRDSIQHSFQIGDELLTPAQYVLHLEELSYDV